MLMQFPSGTQIVPTANSNNIELTQIAQGEGVPDDVHEFLEKLGWTTSCNCADTSQPLYQKVGSSFGVRNEFGTVMPSSNCYFRWYEAMAYEWFRMMSVGG